MPNAHDMAEFALVLARDAIDRMIDHVTSDMPTYEQFVDASMTALGERGNLPDRAAWEHVLAGFVLDGARDALHPSEPGPHEPNIDEIYALIGEGNHTDAFAMATSFLAGASGNDPDVADIVHHAHIVRGKVLLAEGDVDASARELVAAGGVDGSPILDSFGPDLSLAWDLLRAGCDDDVVNYLRAVARFWSPPDRATATR